MDSGVTVVKNVPAWEGDHAEWGSVLYLLSTWQLCMFSTLKLPRHRCVINEIIVINFQLGRKT